MEVPARELLTVIWNGEIVPGITFYGLTWPGRWARDKFPGSSWPAGTQAKESQLHGTDWEVIVWDVAVSSWPKGQAWRRAVHDSTAQLLAGGSVVAWLGREGYFCDPPDLFSPKCMSGGVLAAMTSAGDFDCAVDPDESLRHLGDEALLRLRLQAKGLADAS